MTSAVRVADLFDSVEGAEVDPVQEGRLGGGVPVAPVAGEGHHSVVREHLVELELLPQPVHQNQMFLGGNSCC